MNITTPRDLETELNLNGLIMYKVGKIAAPCVLRGKTVISGPGITGSQESGLTNVSQWGMPQEKDMNQMLCQEREVASEQNQTDIPTLKPQTKQMSNPYKPSPLFKKLIYCESK